MLRILVAVDDDVTVVPSPAETVRMPFDSGCAAGRNELARHVRTEYLLQLDDDMVLTKETDLAGTIRQLDACAVLDYIGGVVDHDDSPPFAHTGCLKLHDGELVVRLGVSSGSVSGHSLYDIVNSCIYVARASRMKELRWDADLKTLEHIEFFVRHVGCIYATQSESLRARTVRDIPPEYAAFRFGRTAQFGGLSWRKMGIHRRYTVGADGNVERHAAVDAAGNHSGELRSLPRSHELHRRVEALFAAAAPRISSATGGHCGTGAGSKLQSLHDLDSSNQECWQLARVAWLGEYWHPLDRRVDFAQTLHRLEARAASCTEPAASVLLSLLVQAVSEQRRRLEASGNATLAEDEVAGPSSTPQWTPTLRVEPLAASTPADAWVYAWHSCSLRSAEAIFRTGRVDWEGVGLDGSDVERLSAGSNVKHGFYASITPEQAAAYACSVQGGAPGRDGGSLLTKCGELALVLCALNLCDVHPVTHGIACGTGPGSNHSDTDCSAAQPNERSNSCEGESKERHRRASHTALFSRRVTADDGGAVGAATPEFVVGEPGRLIPLAIVFILPAK